MHADPTRFTRRDEVNAEWRIITPIEEAWAELPVPAFPNYGAGSEGPAEANALVGRGGHHWRPIVPPRNDVTETAATTPSVDATPAQP